VGLLYEELTYTIQGCIFDVHNLLGTGYDEESYHLALEIRLAEENIPFQSKVIKYVEHRGKKVHKFVADFIIDNCVILELKCIQNNFHSAHYSQILSYLKCWQMEIGFLVNFGLPRVNIKRVIYTPKTPKLIEDYDNIQGLVNSSNRLLLKILRKAILSIFDIHGIGYEAAIYEKILVEELAFQKLPLNTDTIIPIKYHDQLLRQFELKMPVINNQIICNTIALKEHINNDLMKLKTYLKVLDLPLGLLVHFGKASLEIHGVRP